MAQTKLTPRLLETLHATCNLAFADLDELATLTGTARRTMNRRLERLRELGLVTSVSHSVGLGRPTRRRKRQHQVRRRRFYPTRQGIREVAADLDEQEDSITFWDDLPVHPKVFGPMTSRLDALAVIYSLAALIVEITFGRSEKGNDTDNGPVSVRHFANVKDSPFDTVLTLASGQRIGIIRVGRRNTITRFRDRWLTCARAEGGEPDAVLILTATGTAWRQAYEIVSARPGPPAYCAHERDVLKKRRRIWGAPSEARVVDLRAILRTLPDARQARADEPTIRAATRIDQYPESHPTHSPAVCLTPPEKVLLDVISDWHLVSRSDMPGLTGVSTTRVSQMLPRLTAQGLVKVIKLPRRKYYALSDKGINYIAGRDRVRLQLSTWSVEMPPPLGPYGGQMRALIRQIDHTNTVTRLMSELAREAQMLRGYRLSDLDPPERALIRTNHLPSKAVIEPDAGGQVKYANDAGVHWMPFVLEYEHRRINERRATIKVKLYQDFFNSDHRWGPGGPPLALFLFDTPDDEARFFQVAKRLETDEPHTRRVPFALSSVGALEESGFLGGSWLVPDDGGEDRRWPLINLKADLPPQ